MGGPLHRWLFPDDDNEQRGELEQQIAKRAKRAAKEPKHRAPRKRHWPAGSRIVQRFVNRQRKGKS